MSGGLLPSYWLTTDILLRNISGLGTTSSSNTVVAGADSLQDPEDSKLVRECEER